ncbi:MAG: transcription elongation factor GreA [Alphaproteobacteria bacterium]
MERIPMTQGGYQRLVAELKQLKEIERPAVITAISEARSHGDLSENAEYHAARERQSFIEGRVVELESMIGHAEVIDPTKLSGKTVRFGATVTLVDEETEDESTYQIVGAHESDVKQGLISVTSPLARALIGRGPGDSIEVNTPNGGRTYEILKVEYV